jgi:hypothetical protein
MSDDYFNLGGAPEEWQALYKKHLFTLKLPALLAELSRVNREITKYAVFSPTWRNLSIADEMVKDSITTFFAKINKKFLNKKV